MIRLLAKLGVLCALGLPLWGQLPAQLKVQEAVPQGVTGVSRLNAVFTSGVPVALSDGILCASANCAIGASPNTLILKNGAGTRQPSQFRVLNKYPSGYAHWVLVTGQIAEYTSGSPYGDLYLDKVSSGGGNFGGSDLATDNGATISVSTGGKVFTIKKAYNNGFDVVTATLSGSTIVATGTSDGLVLMGPRQKFFPATGANYVVGGSVGSVTGWDLPSVSCTNGTDTSSSVYAPSAEACDNPFYLKNDPSSTAVIEENGPLRAVIKIDGRLMDSAGNAYMKATIRLTFHADTSRVKADVLLRNADDGTSSTFATATKGYASLEWKTTANLGAGTKSFAFGGETAISGDFSSTENAYLYQAFSSPMESQYWHSATCPVPPAMKSTGCTVSYITRTGAYPAYPYAQNGYQIRQGTTDLATGDSTKTVGGWADLKNASGLGIETGVYYLTGYWPKSLVLNGSTGVTSIGIQPDQALWTGTCSASPCRIPYYQVWPNYSSATLFFNFHDTGLSAPADDFNRFQYPLVARAGGATPWDYYNATAGFLYKLIDPSEEDQFWRDSLNRYGTATDHWMDNAVISEQTPRVFHNWAWRVGGGDNQSEVPWGQLMGPWLMRGMGGDYVDSVNWYRFDIEAVFARADGFTWRSKTAAQLDAMGFPSLITSDNYRYAMRPWLVGESVQGYAHAHWYGLITYYLMTGDEAAKDAILQGAMDIHANTKSAAQLGTNQSVTFSRAIGHFLAGSALLYDFTQSVDGSATDLANIATTASNIITQNIVPDYCSDNIGTHFPGPCPVRNQQRGVSRTRGVGASNSDIGDDTNCDASIEITGYQGDGTHARYYANNYFLVGQVPNKISGLTGTNAAAFNVSGTVTAVTNDWFEMANTTVQTLVGTTTPGAGQQTGLADIADIPCGKPWMDAIQIVGMRAAAKSQIPGLDKQLLLDMANGMAQWADREGWVEGSPADPSNASLKYDVALSQRAPMLPISGDVDNVIGPAYQLLAEYHGKLTSEQRRHFELEMLHYADQNSWNPDKVTDLDMYITSPVLYEILHPPTNSLSGLLTVSKASCGAGCFDLTITPPTGVQSYRVKQYGATPGRTFDKEWIGYNPKNYDAGSADPGEAGWDMNAPGCAGDCTGNPNTTVPWFAGTEVTAGASSTCPPTPPATTCRVQGLNPSLTWNFAAKAWVANAPGVYTAGASLNLPSTPSVDVTGPPQNRLAGASETRVTTVAVEVSTHSPAATRSATETLTTIPTATAQGGAVTQRTVIH